MSTHDDSRRGRSPSTEPIKGEESSGSTIAASASGAPTVAEPLRLFAQQHPELLAVYLFGSEATGTAGPLSDIDIALLLDTDALAQRSDEQPLGPQAYYTAALQVALRRPDVDVVLLHRATPLLAHRVIAEGRLIFCRDDRARAAFHARALMRYLDTRPLRQLERAYLSRRLEEDRFGRARRTTAARRTPTGPGETHG